MATEPAPRASGVGTFFNVVERLTLFALSLAVGILNLLIALALAAHLGILSKAAAARVERFENRATALLNSVMGAPARGAAKRKAKP